MPSWTERYRAGEHAQVWADMLALGADVRTDAQLWGEARAVAELTMTRARHNVETLIPLLRADGYEFRHEGDQLYAPPEPDVSEQLDRLEATIGVMPLALRAWFEFVGQVDLTGEHPRWRFDYSDPLVVYAPFDYIQDEYDEWKERDEDDRADYPFTIHIAPDDVHKAEQSGGPPYGIEVPDAAVDGDVVWEHHDTTFVDYLRIAFAWGGFPGWHGIQGGEWNRPNEPTPPVIAEWAARLLPL